MLITRAHLNDPCYRQIEESVPHSPLMRMGGPDGVVLPDNPSPSDIATFQRQLELRCKTIHGGEQVFAHEDVASWRVSANNMIPAPTTQEFDYAFYGWAEDVAAVTAAGGALPLAGSGSPYIPDGVQSV